MVPNFQGLVPFFRVYYFFNFPRREKNFPCLIKIHNFTAFRRGEKQG